MSIGSPIVKVRVRSVIKAQIERDIERLNRLPQHGAMTMSEWLMAAIIEKLDHPVRSRKASRKRLSATKKFFRVGKPCPQYTAGCRCDDCVVYDDAVRERVLDRMGHYAK